jgi:hypothetical protein
MRPPNKDREPLKRAVLMGTRGALSTALGAVSVLAVVVAAGTSAFGVAKVPSARVVSEAVGPSSLASGSGGGNSTNQTRITTKLSAVAMIRFLF